MAANFALDVAQGYRQAKFAAFAIDRETAPSLPEDRLRGRVALD